MGNRDTKMTKKKELKINWRNNVKTLLELAIVDDVKAGDTISVEETNECYIFTGKKWVPLTIKVEHGTWVVESAGELGKSLLQDMKIKLL